MFLFRMQPQVEVVRAEEFHLFEWYLGWVVIVSLAVSQPIIMALGFLYFRKLHPWARILNEKLAMENGSSSEHPLNHRDTLNKLQAPEARFISELQALNRFNCVSV